MYLLLYIYCEDCYCLHVYYIVYKFKYAHGRDGISTWSKLGGCINNRHLWVGVVVYRHVNRC